MSSTRFAPFFFEDLLASFSDSVKSSRPSSSCPADSCTSSRFSLHRAFVNFFSVCGGKKKKKKSRKIFVFQASKVSSRSPLTGVQSAQTRRDSRTMRSLSPLHRPPFVLSTTRQQLSFFLVCWIPSICSEKAAWSALIPSTIPVFFESFQSDAIHF